MGLLQLLTFPVLGAIAWEDFRQRSIRWWWLPLLLLFLGMPLWTERTGAARFLPGAFNLGFLLVQGSAALALVMLRRGRWTSPLQHWIGLGDLLFLMVVAIALPTWSFLAYYLSGLVFAIGMHLLLTWLRPDAERTVPLAGFLAIHLVTWQVLTLLDVLPAWPHAPLPYLRVP